MFYESSHHTPQALSQPKDVAQLIATSCKSKVHKYKDGDSLAFTQSVIRVSGQRNSLSGLSKSQRREYVNSLCTWMYTVSLALSNALIQYTNSHFPPYSPDFAITPL